VSPRPWRLITALVITAAATACTAGNQSPADNGPKAEAPQTIEVWHGWSASHEVKAFEDAIAGFHRLHPNITVKLVKGQDDTKILNAIRSGNPPDVVSSFTTNNVGQFCSSGALQDLTPYLK
jgi:ABC-type glycerol-3-phosphate transport system substrate-binding protein